MVIFSTPTKLDLRLLTTFGVSIKPETPSPIGFFGTGLKYALAVLAREGAGITIRIGKEEHRLTKSVETIRDKEVELLSLGSIPLPFSTDLGKNWQLWMAYRELYSNTLDEGGIVGPGGLTEIRVDSTKFEEVHSNRSKFILRLGKPIVASDNCEIHNGSSTVIFYRGIAAHTLSKPSRFTYNILSQESLTEDRTFANTYSIYWRIAETLCNCQDEEIIRKVVLSSDDFFESTLDFDWPFSRPSEEFSEVVGGLSRTTHLNVNRSAVALLRSLNHEDAMPAKTSLTTAERQQLVKALAFLKTLGMELVEEEIVFTESLGTNILGSVLGGKIYIARRAFLAGTKCLAGTLLEEHLHLRHGLSDYTSGMQNFLIDLIISVGEQKFGGL